MDTSIRTLLTSAQQYSGHEKNAVLVQAYDMLRNIAENKPAVDAPDAFSSDLYVLCAEIAFQSGLRDMAKECLKMYFMKPPPSNQFLCRAYLCQAQLLAPQHANSTEQLEKAVVYLVKAITLAKSNQRYHFLVYNASVIYWQFCRPFLKPNYRQYLAQSLHQIVRALDEIEDEDYEWRAQLMIALIECHLDAGRKSDAVSIATAAAAFIKQQVPSLYKQVFGLIVRNQLMDSTKLQKDVKSSAELSVYYRICRLKVSWESEETKDYYNEIQKLLVQIGVPQKERAPYPEKFTRQKSSRSQSPASSTLSSRDEIDKDRPYLLLELARMCLELDFSDLAQDCVDQMKACNVKEQGFYIEVEFLQCDLTMKKMGDRQQSYQKSCVDVRLQAIKQCEEGIMNAVRLGDPNIIQVGCVTQWNLCLPLLQPNLRHHVRKPLALVAEALEDIQSLLVQLRCQVHTELARCEEEEEQVQVAMENLRKALELDDSHIYKERLEVSLHRLELRAELYKTPTRAEDIAGMIIEQARKADSGTIRMKRSLLVKAGEALAPDAFLLVLDSESQTKDATGGKVAVTQIKKLANKARQFTKCVRKAEGHLKRLGDENDRERARLWGDLAKTARKQEVWDVCRAAARFTILYDDGRWKNQPARQDSPRTEKTRIATEQEGSSTQIDLPSKSSAQDSSLDGAVVFYEKDLIRMLAEVNFINGEALVQLLRSEGVQLNDVPIPPEDKSKHPKGYIPTKPEDDPDWIEYCDWIKMMSEEAVNSFLRGLNLGVELEESWLVCSGATYIWNYNNHILTQLRHREILDPLTVVLDGLKKVGHAGVTMILVNICAALAYALMKPWIPGSSGKGSPESGAQSPSPREKPGSSNKKGRGASSAGKLKPVTQLTIDPDAMPDLKKAVEVCEYVIEVTNGSNQQDVVPIAVRMPLLQTWVSAKQMAQQQIPKTLGADDEPYSEGQRQFTRSIVAVEMMSLSRNGIMEFKDMPSVADIANMIEECKWMDKFIELQLWTRTTYLAYEQKQHDLVVRCSKKALRFAVTGTQPKNRKIEAHRYMVEQEMLSYSSGILGRSLVDNMSGKNAIRREALSAFLDSARYARNAENYELVMMAARQYWNACVPLVSQPIERELLREPIRVILQCITATAEKIKKKEDKKVDETAKMSGEHTGSDVEKRLSRDSQDDDLSLRAALYGVLFQSYTDKRQWEAGLEAMDEAIADMPRTKHRLLIFKHRVMTKAKLGRSVAMDIQKFKDESEDYVAHMWRRVALSSKETVEQLQSYQSAITALNNPSNEWLKVDYLFEFAQWLYVSEFPQQDAIEQLEWAVDIMLNMKSGDEDGKKGIAQNTKRAGKGIPKKEKKQSPVKRAGSAKPRGRSKSPVSDSGRKSPGGASKASDAKSEVSDLESEIGPEGYIPVVKEAVIGVLPVNSSLAIEDLTDIRQLDGLVRAHVLLAEIHGPASTCYKDQLLMAHAFLMRLWQVSMSASAPVIKELAKNPPQGQTSPGGKIDSGKNKKKEKEKETVIKEKPKRKGPLDVLPNNPEQWALYDVPDEVLDAFRHESMKTTGINDNTLTKPLLTLHYLDAMTKALRELGYNHLTLSVLAFEDMLSRGLLKSHALHVLVHAKAQEVCLELNLKNGLSFHEKLTGEIKINEEDQALCREKIALWKEGQIQVAREELRVKETLARLAEEASKLRKSQSVLSRPGITTSLEPEVEVDSHLGKVLGAVTFQDVWTDTAELLLRQGQYQNSREFLAEAFNAAKVFEDIPLQARILYLLGRLSLKEAQYGQAIQLCKTAQGLHSGDEMFWYDTTMLMVEASQQNYNNRNALRIARGILIFSLNEFLRITDERPNRHAVTGYIIAMLKAKLASVQIAIILEEHSDINTPKVMKAVLSVCEKLDSATENLTKLGYKREALPLMKEHAKVLLKLARESVETEIQHTYYLQVLFVLKEAVWVAEDVFNDAQTLTSLQDVRNLSLPTQREAADMKIEYGKALVEIYKVHSNETRNRQLENQRKGSILRMVEDFIRETPDYTYMEKEWVITSKIGPEDALLKFVDAHNLGDGIPRIKAQSLCGIGQCLRALAVYKDPDPPTQWIVHEMEIMSISTLDQEDEGEGATHFEEDPQSKSYIKYSKQIRDMKEADKISKNYLAQATECLVQAMNLALQKQYMDIASTAALELTECCGQFDPGASSQFLALFQSCQTSQFLQTLLHKAQLDPVTSKLASILHQRDSLLSTDITTNASAGTLMESISSSLTNDWQAWKNLQVSTQHLDLLKEFPPNFNFVVLQHSPDRTFLYGAVLDKPKGSGSIPGKGGNPKQALPGGPGRARVFGVDTSPKQLEELLSAFSQHRQDVQQFLLKQEYQRSQAMMRKKMLQNLEDSTIGGKSEFAEEDAEEEEGLQEQFRYLVSKMEDYIKPVMDHIDSVLMPPPVTPVSNGKEGKDASSLTPEYLVLLADKYLMEMPLEAIQSLKSENIASLSRDFSLQLLYHRITHEEPQGEDQGGDKKKKPKEVDKPFSRIPGLRDISKKQAKIIPLTRQIQPWCQPVDTMNVRYIVDPNLDCAETEEHKPVEVFEKILEEYEQQFTPRWLGVTGTDHVPSVGEWEIYLVENSSFIFYGMERLLSYIPPAKLSALNIPECMMVYLLDHAQTSKSFMRQSKIDVLKSPHSLALEKPVETAMLLSLAGVRCVLTNQWSCTLAENAVKLKVTLKDLLEAGKSTGETTRLIFTPYQRKVEETNEDKAEPKKPSDNSTDQDGDESQRSQDVIEQKVAEVPVAQMSWYNLICYGMPNLVITQV